MSLFRGKTEQTDAKPEASAPVPTPTTLPPTRAPGAGDEKRMSTGERGSTMANIGKSISIKGNVTGDEDTVIEGRVDGHVELGNHHLTVGPNGEVKGEITAKQCTIVGNVRGNVTATERIEIAETGRIEGDLVSPRLLIQEGAQVNGSISMQPKTGAQVAETKAQAGANGKGKPAQPQRGTTPEPQQTV